MTLGEVVRAAATSLEGVVVDAADIRAGAQTIVVVADDGSWAEFRLDPAVATAARRTPDTSASDRGPDWVRFAPAGLDGHASDRAVAWLRSAARRAGGGLDSRTGNDPDPCGPGSSREEEDGVSRP